MTEAQRRTAIVSLLRQKTAANTITKETARATLIKDGIYKKDGALKATFGGKAGTKQVA